MNCPRCGTTNHDNLSNCIRCGAALVPAGEAETFIGISRPPMAAKPAAAAAPAPAPAARPADASNMPTAGPWAALGVAGDADHVDFGPRYRIDRMLGQGGMGAVYKAWDKALDRPVALKLIRPGLALDPGIEQRFKQELLLASKISHKNILRIHDLGEAAGVKFISMAFIEGHDLHQVMEKEGKLPVERALAIAKQLCAALVAAHAEGVVHRDFKPQNILLDKQENVYVSDFGLAKSLEQDTGMTKSGEFLGTPRYMAPEQAQGGKIDHRADLYAMGLILYEMVTGDVPFHADTTLQLMYKRVHEAPKSPRTLNPDLPDWLVRVIMKCLERDPGQRYQTAGEILRDLETGTAPAGSRSVQIALPGFAVNRTWLAIAGTLVVLVAALMAVPSVRQRIFGRPQTATEQIVEAKHVAVLPLKIIGDEKALGYISDGVVDALTAKLFQLKDVQIAAPSAVSKLKPDTPLPDAANALGANFIVTGNLQSEGDKIRLVLNLDDVAGGKRLWTQEFSGLKQDLLTLEDNAYAKLVSALSIKASTEELARTSAHPTENQDAYDLYLKAKSTFSRSELDRKTIQDALQQFQQATQRDPNFALAYTGIADASLRMYRETKEGSWVTKAEAAAKQADRLNDNLAEVHSSLGAVYAATGKPAEAVAELKRTVELAPNFDEGYRKLGDAYRAAGRKQEAVDAYNKAIQANPYYWLNHDALGTALARAGDNDKALSAYKHATELSPNNPVPYRNMGVVYFQQGKFNECIPLFQKALSFQPHFATYSNLGTAYFYLKRYNEAVQMYEKAVEINPNQETVMGNLGDAYRWSGKISEANSTYDKAIGLALKELQVNPRNAAAMGSLALYYAKKGERAQATSFIRRARAVDPNDTNQIYNQAIVQALAGDTAQALQTLRECFEKGYPARQAASDPELATLHANPLFATLVQQYTAKKK
jgi:tetratricopeptide (TPR) repeat protein